MLILPIKKKWFDMILSGEKKEEYRECKRYWAVRLENAFCKPYKAVLPYCDNLCAFLQSEGSRYYTRHIIFRNGYGKNSSSFTAKCTLSVGTGKEEWGAEKGRQYFILTIKRILPETIKREGGRK